MVHLLYSHGVLAIPPWCTWLVYCVGFLPTGLSATLLWSPDYRALRHIAGRLTDTGQTSALKAVKIRQCRVGSLAGLARGVTWGQVRSPSETWPWVPHRQILWQVHWQRHRKPGGDTVQFPLVTMGDGRAHASRAPRPAPWAGRVGASLGSLQEDCGGRRQDKQAELELRSPTRGSCPGTLSSRPLSPGGAGPGPAVSGFSRLILRHPEGDSSPSDHTAQAGCNRLSDLTERETGDTDGPNRTRCSASLTSEIEIKTPLSYDESPPRLANPTHLVTPGVSFLALGTEAVHGYELQGEATGRPLA